MKHLHTWSASIIGIGLSILAGTAAAGEVILPPLGCPAVVQTNGPQGVLGHGDWWSNSASEAGQQPHCFNLYVPPTVPADFGIQLQLFDPECYQTAGELDERKGGVWDETRFRLLAPDGATVIADITYQPAAQTSGIWNPFAQFTASQHGSGIYQILVTTGVDDENTYRLKIVEDDPDGIPGSGDELHLAIAKSSLQMASSSIATLHFYVPPATDELLLANFGMDSDGAIWYSSPAGDSLPGTLSGSATWNNSTAATLPPPGGDIFTSPQSGWWTTSLISYPNNQFTVYTSSPFFLNEPVAEPELIITLQNGHDRVRKGEIMTYTVNLRNQGEGPALACSLNVALSPGLTVTDPGEGTLASPQTWRWTTDLLPPGGESTLTFLVFVSSASTSPVAATASATCQDPLFQHFASPDAMDIDQLLVFGSISGIIWHDVDHNGLREISEPGMANIKLDLYTLTLEIFKSDTSNAAGEYSFADLPIGDYQVRPDAAYLPQGWDATTTVQTQWLTVTDLGETHSNIDLGYNAFETPVELTRFTAQAQPGAIHLNWTTQSETDNLGFHLYRSMAESGPFSRITANLIAGAGNSQVSRYYSYSDEISETGSTFYYKISDVSYAGVETMHGPVAVTALAAPAEFALGQNYPNPFNSSTVINFSMKESGSVRLAIHNLLGQVVRTLAEEVREAGEHRLVWDGKDESGMAVPAGVYIYTMQVNQFRMTRKMQLLR
jgi:uncharacterized repeat protein (TIGR01451 family)